jgi:hypothetical protein
MDIEFHYWITGIIANRARFSEEDAQAIAYSCQYTDDNDEIRTIKDPGTKEEYSNYISQTMDILKPKRTLMRIYPIFHFLPGDPLAIPARRRDGKMHVLVTTPDSKLAGTVLSNALQMDTHDSQRLYRIGIASHAYADTWAHQNFVGWYDGFNGELLNPLPNIGHVDFMYHPDWPGHRWQDPRIIQSDVNNNDRFLAAAKRLYEEYARANGTYDLTVCDQLVNDLGAAMGPVASGDDNVGRDDRLARYHSLAPWLPEYDQHRWFSDAVDTKVRGLPDTILPSLTIFKDEHTWKGPKETTRWYRFQEAVKAHQDLCMGLLKEIFDQMGVDLHQH